MQFLKVPQTVFLKVLYNRGDLRDILFCTFELHFGVFKNFIKLRELFYNTDGRCLCVYEMMAIQVYLYMLFCIGQPWDQPPL